MRRGGRTAWTTVPLPALLAATGCLRPATHADTGAPSPRDERGWALVYEQTFVDPACLADLAFSDASAWRLDDERAGPALELAGPSAYEPPFRSPLAIALVRDLWVEDFALDVDIQSTSREYAHRDLCLVFGFESSAELRYAHLASTPDENAHNVFTVHGAPRAPLAPIQTKGVSWGEGWHHVELVRQGEDVRVSLDGEIVLEARDPDPREGRVGFGSFDDTGRFRALRISAPSCSIRREGDPFGR